MSSIEKKYNKKIRKTVDNFFLRKKYTENFYFYF